MRSTVNAPSALDSDLRRAGGGGSGMAGCRAAPSRWCASASRRRGRRGAAAVLGASSPSSAGSGWRYPRPTGGQGAGLAGLATVVEEWGRAVAPGPFVSTALAATVLGQHAPQHAKAILGGDPAAVMLPPTGDGQGLFGERAATVTEQRISATVVQGAGEHGGCWFPWPGVETPGLCWATTASIPSRCELGGPDPAGRHG